VIGIFFRGEFLEFRFFIRSHEFCSFSWLENKFFLAPIHRGV
jgi:hypothetical protein